MSIDSVGLLLKYDLFFVRWFLKNIFGMITTSTYHLIQSNCQEGPKKWTHKIDPDIANRISAGKERRPRLRAGFMLAPDSEFAINPATRITNPTAKPLSARLNRLSVAEDIFTSIRKKVRTISIVSAGRI